ncbi:hypothetical protein D3C72_1766220 [compost metagenome]
MTGRQRLLAADIDHRPCQMPELQRLNQITINHRHATPGIDEQRIGIEPGKQRSIVQIVGSRGIREQIDHVIDIADQTPQFTHGRHFDEGGLFTGLTGDTVEFDAKRQEELSNPLTNITCADDQHPAPFQAAPGAVIPLALNLADQARHHFPFVPQQVGQDVFGHHLAEDANRTGQAIVTLQAVCQQWRDTRPGRLQPLRLVPLAQ